MTARLLPLLLICTFACTSDDDAPDERVDEVLALTGDAAAGEEVYATRCESCHAADGTGTVSPTDLNDYVPANSDETIVGIILDGTDGMPQFDGVIQPQDMANVVAYLNDAFGS